MRQDDELVHIEDDLQCGAFKASSAKQEDGTTKMRSYKYRIYPNQAITEKLQWVLDRARELYNAALTERKEAWRMAGKSINYFDQEYDLAEIRNDIRPEYKDIFVRVLRDVLRRVDKAYQAFFRRVKNGEKAGYPRFKSKNQYDSFTYPDHKHWKLEGNYLTLNNIGTVKVKFHREVEGNIKTLMIKREGEHWYCIFACEVEVGRLPVSYEDVGIDLGVTHFAALSDGEFIDHPRYFRNSEKKLVKTQQSLARKKRGSHRRAKAVRRVAKQHRRICNQRQDFQHKASRKLVNRYQIIVFEDLRTANLTKRPKPKQDEETGKFLPNGATTKAGLNKSILDAGWYTFTEMVKVKAESAGRTVIFVNPFKTSQLCSGCGAEVKKDLSERWHSCSCGTELDRDTNAAKVILNLGYKQLSGGIRPTPPSA